VLFLAPTHAAKNTAKAQLQSNFSPERCNNITFETLQSVINEYNNPITGNWVCNLLLHKNEYNYIIIDEMSMVSSNDFNKFLNVLTTEYNDISEDNEDSQSEDEQPNPDNSPCSIVLVGDYDQLPPISTGNPFKDMIMSGKLPVFKLTKNHRSDNSDIPEFLERVNTENTFLNYKSTHRNYILSKTYNNIHQCFNKEYMTSVEQLLIKLKQDGFVLYNGNNSEQKTLQIVCNKNAVFKKEKSNGIVQKVRKIFYNMDSNDLYEVGDLVILTKNTKCYKNGDYARIISIYMYTCTLELLNPVKDIKKVQETLKDDPDNNIKLDINGNITINTNDISPSYAMTVHKSQGLGFNKVICIYEWRFANKNLNYTAFSRAKEDIYLFGEQRCYNNENMSNKKTLLYSFLTDNISRPLKSSNRDEDIIKTPNIQSIPDSPDIIKESINKRKSIPKKVKNDVFIKRNGREYKGVCFVCDKPISIVNFHTGHIKSVCYGGDNSIDNLEPICAGCNLSMGKENLQTYKDTYYKNKST